MRILVEISYNGARFHGFQYQHHERTIQGEIEKLLSQMHKRKVRIHPASRTDRGVHALNQYFHFDTELNIPLDRYEYAMSSRLPDDIHIHQFKVVDSTFHARYMTKGKTYRYKIYTGEKNPFYSQLKTHVERPVDIEKVKATASDFIGTHDFTTFSSAKASIENKVRHIHDCHVEETPDGFDIVITGSGFLYHMVRIIVSYLLEVGQNRRERDTKNLLLKKDRTLVPTLAPAEGLYLERVFYEEIEDND